MRLVIIFVVVSVFFCTPLFLRAEQTSTKQIQVQALLISADVNVGDSVWKDLGILSDLKKMPDRGKLLAACAKRKDIVLFSFPRINVLEGVKGSSNVTQLVQYMKRLKDGNFALKIYYKEQVGTIFEATAKVSEDDSITVEINFKVSELKARLPIEGVQLDVGYPVIYSNGAKTVVKLKNGEMVWIGGMSNLRNVEKGIIKTAGPTHKSIGYPITVILLTARIL